MCGIAGLLAFDGAPVDPARLAGMTRRLAHRGPDGEGAVLIDAAGSATLYRDLDRPPAPPPPAGVGLAHRRLSIIELSDAGAQPMNAGHCWVTFNGELYNYVELRDELRAAGHAFRSGSDTEVLLRAYLEWGDEAVRKFNGMFAFAVWDQRRRRLFCARDHLGIKPFYYHADGARFAFASEQKALLPALDGAPAPNRAAMADFLAFSYVPSVETMFAGVRKLPAGGWLSVDADGALREGRYWDPEFTPDAAGDAERVEQLRALLDDAMRMQLRSDVPLGAHLSGGIDSSAVTCLAAARLPGITTFTAKFAAGGFYDETPYARLVAERVGADYRELTPRPTDLAALLPKIVYHLDEPVEAASVFGKYHVAEAVGREVKVVLGGQGGDELFGGYDWYVKSAATAICFGAGGALMQRSRLGFVAAALRRESPKRLAKALWKNRFDRDLARIFCRSWARVSDAEIAALFADPLDTTPQRRFLQAFDALRVRRPADALFKFDMRYYLESLLTSEDRLSMAFSVESRVPLLDYRIAELAARTGFESKAVPGRSKQLLRRAVDGIVPDEILARRDKRGFPTPIGQWLADPQLKLMERFVLNDNPFAARYFDLDRVRHSVASKTLLSSDWSERLWRLLNLCVWGKVFGLR